MTTAAYLQTVLQLIAAAMKLTGDWPAAFAVALTAVLFHVALVAHAEYIE